MSVKSLTKPEDLLLITTTVLGFFFFFWGINSWKFSFVGDEWPFYVYALNFTVHPHPLNPLSFSGVYGTHSPLASMYQVLFMELFGINNVAWRLSNIVLIFPLSFFFYRWIKLSFNKQTAVLATILMQCSFFLANFFKIGYDNPQSLTLLIICFYLAATFGKSPTKKLGLLLGGILGISFYMYFGAAFPLFIWPYFLPLRNQIRNKATRKAIQSLIITYLLLLCPLIFQIPALLNVRDALGQPGSFHLKSNIIYDFLLFYKNHDYYYNHFITGPYLDSISQVFCVIGTILVLFRVRHQPYLFFLLSYISTVIFIGSTSADGSSPVTRGLFLLPFGFFFAGLGLNTLRETIKGRVISFAFCWILILAIATLNVYQSQISIFAGNTIDYTGMSLILHSLQQNQTAHKEVIIVLSPELNINQYTWVLPYMKQAYGLKNISYSLLNPSQLSCSETITKATLLVFNYDHNARKKIQKLTCGTPLTSSILSPATTFY
ncbi:MAG TPA: glycosyltransferase family 39 protein [Candidatus Acidoferrales bacterium]|nr:glycosyltransferase family 39 protein [Candidatus Acidoferrales bacterium]